MNANGLKKNPKFQILEDMLQCPLPIGPVSSFRIRKTKYKSR